MDWVEISDEQKYYIFKFDDGLTKVKDVYPNLWYITARWKGKVNLKNVDTGVIVPSISEWKINKCFN